MEDATFDTLIETAQGHPSTPELDLHGEHLQNAQYKIETFLDKQFRKGEKVVKIVTGVGSGVLAGQIPDIIEASPHVLFIRIARTGFEGGSAVYAVLNE